MRVATQVQAQQRRGHVQLCHFLKVEPKTGLKAALTTVLTPALAEMRTSGAKKGGNSWGQLIQTLIVATTTRSAFLKCSVSSASKATSASSATPSGGDSRKTSSAPSSLEQAPSN